MRVRHVSPPPGESVLFSQRPPPPGYGGGRAPPWEERPTGLVPGQQSPWWSAALPGVPLPWRGCHVASKGSRLLTLWGCCVPLPSPLHPAFCLLPSALLTRQPDRDGEEPRFPLQPPGAGPAGAGAEPEPPCREPAGAGRLELCPAGAPGEAGHRHQAGDGEEVRVGREEAPSRLGPPSGARFHQHRPCGEALKAALPGPVLATGGRGLGDALPDRIRRRRRATREGCGAWRLGVPACISVSAPSPPQAAGCGDSVSAGEGGG